MTRRLATAGFALAGPKLRARQHSAETLCIPQAHFVKDRKLLHDCMDEFVFVDLITAAPAIRITHIPVLLDVMRASRAPSSGISRQNPQRAALERGEQAMIIFRGLHSYISPSWHAKNRGRANLEFRRGARQRQAEP